MFLHLRRIFLIFLAIQENLILKTALFFQYLVSYQAEKVLLVVSLNAPRH